MAALQLLWGEELVEAVVEGKHGHGQNIEVAAVVVPLYPAPLAKNIVGLESLLRAANCW